MIEYSGKDWLGVLGRVRGSIIAGIWVRLLITAGIGLFAAWLFDATAFSIPTVIHTMVGVALGLLLVFRTNASFDRYWEGRRLLGTIVNRMRDLARQFASLVEGRDPATEHERRVLARHLVLTYALVRQYLRRETDLATLGALVTPEERAELERVVARPALPLTWISHRLAALARRGQLSEERLRVIDANLTAIFDSWGGAERIMRTPIPFAYAHHIKAFLVLFCFSAPFALSQSMAWYTPIGAVIVAFALFGIDEIGVEIEDPFGYDANDLPLEAVGAAIERDVGVIAALAAGPAPRDPAPAP